MYSGESAKRNINEITKERVIYVFNTLRYYYIVSMRCLTFILIFLQIWSARQWCYFTTFSDLGEKIFSVDYSANGEFLAVGSAANRVSIYSTKTYDVLWYENLPNDVLSAKFSPDGSYLAVTQNGTDQLRVYSVSSTGIGTLFYTTVPPSPSVETWT